MLASAGVVSTCRGVAQPDESRLDVDECSATERWRAVVGYEGHYEVSDWGRVRSLDRTLPVSRRGFTSRFYPGRTRRLGLSSSGRMHVALYGKQWQVHHLVLSAFVGPRPSGTECCHNNGNPVDNRLVNLRWDTHRSNCMDMQVHGTAHQRNKSRCPRGHPLDQPNLVRNTAASGWRGCLACHRAITSLRHSGHATEEAIQSRSDRNYELIMDGYGPGQRRPACAEGHEFTPENTRTDRRGGRRCKTCAATNRRVRRGAQRDKP